MKRVRSSAQFKHEEASLLAQALVRELVHEPSLNEFMEIALPLAGAVFGAERVVLVDYREGSDQFDVLFFAGYPIDGVYSLGRRLEEMEVRRALSRREPFRSERNPNILAVPLYFSDILEAVLAFEGEAPIELTPARLEAAQVASRLIGVLMSSTRLAVNREQLVDINDLQRARQIQLSFLPKQRPASQTCDVYGCNTSSALVGGDYFDYFKLRDGRLQAVLADACGHGMAAALIMSNFRGLLQSEMTRRAEYRELFDSLNKSVHYDEDLIQYLTCVFLDFDESTGALTYWNAGHYEPLVIGPNGQARQLPGGGPPLGMFRDSTYPQGVARMQSGEILTLFTDGLIDIEDETGRYFGVEGVVETVRRRIDRPLEEIAEEVMACAQRFAGPVPIEDDVTLVLMRAV